MSAALRIGLAGFGRLARDYYVPAFRRLAGARLVAVADPLPGSRAVAAHGLPPFDVYSDHRSMLERARLDALLVASPPSTHLAIWNDAAARGLAVFMEKPFVLCGQLDEIVRGAETSNLMLDFNRRFWPTYRRMGELVRGGILGRPVAVEFRLHTDVLSWSTVTQHRFSQEEGGILHDLGGHAIDLATDLLGEEPVTITAQMWNGKWPNDHLQLDLAFSDGSTVRCDLAWGDRTCERLSIRGPDARLYLPDPNMAIHLEGNGECRSRIAARCRDVAMFGYRALRRERAMSRFSIRSALAAFVHALREGEPFSPGFDDAVRNVRWLEAAARSAADGKQAVRPA
ncbi:MAG TPA: Gfo/Idh/MocA family oxidoreductase [Thermoanaerobaculia bacterium]|jgi:predicted dehydrogenase